MVLGGSMSFFDLVRRVLMLGAAVLLVASGVLTFLKRGLWANICFTAGLVLVFAFVALDLEENGIPAAYDMHRLDLWIQR
jgi:hypothetical protein